MALYRRLDKCNLRPPLRFKEFSGNWIWEEGECLFKSVSNKNHYGNLPVLAITQEFGAIPRNMIDFRISVSEASVKGYKVVEKGDFIISLRSFQGGIELSEYNGICSPAYIILRSKKKISSAFFKSYFKSTNYIKNLIQNIEGIRDGKMISFKYFSETGIIYPNIKEQNKIGHYFKAIDSRLQQLTQKKELLEQYKKGVMQQLFSQQLRFIQPDGSDYPDWEEKRLGEVVVRVTRKNKENNQNVLTISAQHGLINQEEYFNKSVSASDVTGYYLLKRDDFAYNKSYSKGYPLGAIKRLTKYDKGVVSTLYIIFKAKNDESISFLEQLFEGGILNKELHKIAQEGARNHGLLNLSVVEFFKDIKIDVPCIEEQQKIANYLSGLDTKIESVAQQITQTQQFKKGLLQQMFV